MLKVRGNLLGYLKLSKCDKVTFFVTLGPTVNSLYQWMYSLLVRSWRHNFRSRRARCLAVESVTTSRYVGTSCPPGHDWTYAVVWPIKFSELILYWVTFSEWRRSIIFHFLRKYSNQENQKGRDQMFAVAATSNIRHRILHRVLTNNLGALGQGISGVPYRKRHTLEKYTSMLRVLLTLNVRLRRSISRIKL